MKYQEKILRGKKKESWYRAISDTGSVEVYGLVER
jgi:hypothetical protein